MADNSPEQEHIQRVEEALTVRKEELARLQASLAEDEANEAARAASTSVYLVPHVVGCRFALTRYPEGKALPEYQFHHPCIIGKVKPDLDCLTCVHHSNTPWGQQNLRPESKRYPDHGAVIPVASEAHADALVEVSKAHAGAQRVLTRPAHIIAALEEDIIRLEAELPQARMRLLQRQQRGG